MKSEDILDAIGNVDDVYVKNAKEKNKNTKKFYRTMGITIGAIAACLAVMFSLPNIRMNFNGINFGSAQSEVSDNIAQEKGVQIYYVDGDDISCKEEYLVCSAEDIFEAWKQENGVGAEVELLLFQTEISCYSVNQEFESEGQLKTEEKKETEGELTTEILEYRVLNIVLSNNMEGDYASEKLDLLLESLKETMTGYSDKEYDECNITFE